MHLRIRIREGVVGIPLWYHHAHIRTSQFSPFLSMASGKHISLTEMESPQVNLMSQPAAHSTRLVAVAAALTVACAGGEQAPLQLGPVDGFDLAPTEIERVAAGTVAPDFSLVAMNGDTLTLSGFHGRKNVVLVFYRGHW